MNTSQNNSPNYDAILQRIQQEIESLKTKLMLKDTRQKLLVAQLKDTQRELEETQNYIDHFLVGSVAAFAYPTKRLVGMQWRGTQPHHLRPLIPQNWPPIRRRRRLNHL